MIPEDLSPRSVLLSPDTVRSVLERPTDPAKRAPEQRFSNIESRLQGLRQTTAASGQQVTAAALDFRQLRRLLRDTSDKLEATTKRANKAETHARDARARTFALEVQHQNAREQNIRATEELKLYKAELQRAQLEVQRAQQEINNLVAERDRAEEDAARSRDMARKATESLRLQQAREEGMRQGIEQGRRQGFMEGRAMGMEEAVASATATAKRRALAAIERVLREQDPAAVAAAELANGGPTRRASISSTESLGAQHRAAAAAAATLTPIQEAALETSPAPTEGLQMPGPHPAQRAPSPAIPIFETTPADAAPPQTIPGFVVPPQPQQPIQPIPQMSFTDALGEPIQRTHSPRPGMFAPAGSPAPFPLGFSPGGLGAGGSGLGVGGPQFTANVIPPTPVPSTPSSTHMMQPSGMPQPTPVAPIAFPAGVSGPSSDPFPPMGVAGPSSEPYPPGPPMGFNGGFPSPQGNPMQFPPSPGASELRDAFDPVVLQPRRKKKMRRPRQDSQGSVPLFITPASPQDSIDTPPSSDDDARTSRTSRSTRRGPGPLPSTLSPRHIPRPPSRRASPSQPHSSRESSPHVVISDATGAPVRVSMREAGDLVEQELEDRRREEAERAMGGRSPLLRSPRPGHSPLPGGVPLPPSGGIGISGLPGGNRVSMYGGAPGTVRSRTSQLSYEEAPGSVPYPRPVSPLARRASPMAPLSFPTSNGTSIIEAVIPGVNATSGYTPAPLDGAPAYPAPVTPGPRAFDATSRASPTSTVGFGLVGPNRATSPTPSQPAFMLSPRPISPRPIVPPVVPPISRAGSPNPMFSGRGDPPRSRSPRPGLGLGASPAQSARHSLAPGGVIPFIPSRPVSRAASMSASLARTDRILPQELPGTATYEAAPNAPFYPPPPTPARVPIPPSPAISRVSRRSNTMRTPRQQDDGAIFDMPSGGWSSLR
ncbi:hypothetical protein AURDEDRAFT_179277 [Auricularia subglabra TFB-10046 SS5]|nr:hypothetical protein AURDEDRAFT_179277 [Auricularia subglabra TFB-10046 SS5]